MESHHFVSFMVKRLGWSGTLMKNILTSASDEFATLFQISDRTFVCKRHLRLAEHICFLLVFSIDQKEKKERKREFSKIRKLSFFQSWKATEVPWGYYSGPAKFCEFYDLCSKAHWSQELHVPFAMCDAWEMWWKCQYANTTLGYYFIKKTLILVS